MSNNDIIFKHENHVLTEIQNFSSDQSLASMRAGYKNIISEYERLLKTTKHLVKLNDRSADRLSELATETQEKNNQLERLSKQLSKYLSLQVYDSIFRGHQKSGIASARKKLTVFFSDIVGFTSITESLEPEDLTAALNYYLTEMSAIALQYGATIDKYIGDAIMVFFGDPTSDGAKEDATRCVSMAIAMQERLQELSGEWATFGLHEPLRMRIGISTGFCTVGNFGSENRLDYTAVGACVNIASRLESKADSGKILLSQNTYNLVKDDVPCAEAGKLTLKGVGSRVRAFKVLDRGNVGPVISIRADQSYLRARLSALSKGELDQLKRSLKEALADIEGHIERL